MLSSPNSITTLHLTRDGAIYIARQLIQGVNAGRPHFRANYSTRSMSDRYSLDILELRFTRETALCGLQAILERLDRQPDDRDDIIEFTPLPFPDDAEVTGA